MILIKNKKLLSFLIFFIPFFSFLKNENLIQIEYNDILIIFSFQILLFVIIILNVNLIKIFFRKINLNFDNALIGLAIIYFYSFFFQASNIKETFKNILVSGYLFSAIIYFSLLIIFFFFIYLNLNNLKNNKYFYNFISILVIANYIFFLGNFFFNKKEDIKQDNLPLNLSKVLKNNQKNVDIYFIILDAMTSLDYAKEKNIIDDKEKFIKKFEKLGAKYINNSFSNYPTSHISIQSILNLNYVVTDKSKKYHTYKNFFPNSLINNYEKLPITIFNNYVDRQFYWTGNKIKHCKSNSYAPKMCGGKENIFVHYFNFLELYYKESLLDFLIRRITSKFTNEHEIQTTFEILNDDQLSFFKNIDFSKKNFFFMHLLKPHDPFDVNKECKKPTSLNNSYGYEDNYKCVLLLVEKFIKNINNFSNKEKVIVFVGDHGYPLDNNKNGIKINNKGEIPQSYKIERSKIFSLIYYPENCRNDLVDVKSLINITRFVLNCANNSKLEYLENKYYFTYYETHKNWGEVEFVFEK